MSISVVEYDFVHLKRNFLNWKKGKLLALDYIIEEVENKSDTYLFLSG